MPQFIAGCLQDLCNLAQPSFWCVCCCMQSSARQSTAAIDLHHAAKWAVHIAVLLPLSYADLCCAPTLARLHVQVAVWDHVKVCERTVFNMHMALTNNIRFLPGSDGMQACSASTDGKLKARGQCLHHSMRVPPLCPSVPCLHPLFERLQPGTLYPGPPACHLQQQPGRLCPAAQCLARSSSLPASRMLHGCLKARTPAPCLQKTCGRFIPCGSVHSLSLLKSHAWEQRVPSAHQHAKFAPVNSYIRMLIPGLQMFDIETGADTELLNLNPEVGHGLTGLPAEVVSGMPARAQSCLPPLLHLLSADRGHRQAAQASDSLALLAASAPGISKLCPVA